MNDAQLEEAAFAAADRELAADYAVFAHALLDALIARETDPDIRHRLRALQGTIPADEGEGIRAASLTLRFTSDDFH